MNENIKSVPEVPIKTTEKDGGRKRRTGSETDGGRYSQQTERRADRTTGYCIQSPLRQLCLLACNRRLSHHDDKTIKRCRRRSRSCCSSSVRRDLSNPRSLPISLSYLSGSRLRSALPTRFNWKMLLRSVFYCQTKRKMPNFNNTVYDEISRSACLTRILYLHSCDCTR